MNAEDSRVTFAGDWHGDAMWANARLQSLGEQRVQTVIHVGDFGIWPGSPGKRFLRQVDAVCKRYGIAMLVVPGNHEDWGRLTALWSNSKNQGAAGEPLPLTLTEHITVLPRGHRWRMGGRSFVALGGAPSVDFGDRVQGRDWWPEEQMSATDVARTVAVGYADVMVTHDSPGPPWCTPRVEAILASNPQGWPAAALDYARVGRERVTEAVLGVRPRLLVHGHFHVSDEVTVRLPGATHDTEIWSLGMNKGEGNVRTLDLDSLTD